MRACALVRPQEGVDSYEHKQCIFNAGWRYMGIPVAGLTTTGLLCPRVAHQMLHSGTRLGQWFCLSMESQSSVHYASLLRNYVPVVVQCCLGCAANLSLMMRWCCVEVMRLRGNHECLQPKLTEHISTLHILFA